ncbi:pyridoxal phosphate-dependent aminotransferase [Bifidobacterium aerophilum]|uniref:Aminotransferase n=1 Tax=Bifidobacterium aerophilum TaxID=1798155 RepID=A0A6N9Z1G8_9BIFI|nr:aminotransferase class I/II-fold pyridoxal phosphate-dependent enzyme [Bifidobacterium aerophilum]NEG88467.1 aminotransferase class I/II-fold pyridoxal phosphate-dependent enzyme [Bifidobacterium aerophilum]
MSEPTDNTSQRTAEAGFDPANAVIPQLRTLTTSIIRSFDAETSTIPGILKLTLGEPDFATPQFIKDAAVDSLARNRTHYAPNAGTPGLRQAISGYLARRRNLQYAPEDIIVTEGASEAVSSALTALLHPGAALLYTVPGFGLYANMAKLTGADQIEIDTTGTGFVLTPEALEDALRSVAGRDAVLVLNSPNNPTGVTYTADQLRALADVVERYDVTMLSDEVYAEISYETRPAPSIALFAPDRTVVVDSTSKTYAMTGWRLGFLAAPHELAGFIAKVHQIHVSTAAMFTMDAAQVAYEKGDESIDRMVAEYRRRRDFLVDGLTGLGYRTANPTGSFFLYVAVPDGFDGSSFDYARLLAREAKVAGVPGEAFTSRPSRYFRFSYAASLDTLREAVARIAAFRDRA